MPPSVPEGANEPPRNGFTLVEVIVSLLVLEVGLLAVAGLVSLSSRTLNRAIALERAAAGIQTVADSIAAAPEVTEGQRAFPGTVVRWVPETESEEEQIRWLRIYSFPPGGESSDTAAALIEVRMAVFPEAVEAGGGGS